MPPQIASLFVVCFLIVSVWGVMKLEAVITPKIRCGGGYRKIILHRLAFAHEEHRACAVFVHRLHFLAWSRIGFNFLAFLPSFRAIHFARALGELARSRPVDLRQHRAN